MTAGEDDWNIVLNTETKQNFQKVDREISESFVAVAKICTGIFYEFFSEAEQRLHPRYFIINMSCTLHCCCCLMALSPPREHSNISHPVGLSSDGAWMCRAQISADKILLKHQQYPLDQLRAQHGINQRAGNRAFAECCGLWTLHNSLLQL